MLFYFFVTSNALQHITGYSTDPFGNLTIPPQTMFSSFYLRVSFISMFSAPKGFVLTPLNST